MTNTEPNSTEATAPIARKALRWTAILLALAGLAAVVLALAYPSLERAALAKADAKLKARNIELTYSGVTTRMNGLVAFDNAVVKARGWTLTCDRMAVNLAVYKALFGDVRADVIDLGHCDASKAASSDEAAPKVAEVADKASSMLGAPLTTLRERVGEVRIASFTLHHRIGTADQTATLSEFVAAFEAGDELRGSLALQGPVTAAAAPFEATAAEQEIALRFPAPLTIKTEYGTVEAGKFLLADGPRVGIGDLHATLPDYPELLGIDAGWLGIEHSDAGWRLVGRDGRAVLKPLPKLPEGSGEVEEKEPPKPRKKRDPNAPKKKGFQRPEGPSAGQRLFTSALERGRLAVALLDLARHDLFGAPRLPDAKPAAPELGPDDPALLGVTPKLEPLLTPQRGKPLRGLPVAPLDEKFKAYAAKGRGYLDKLSTALSSTREPIGIKLENMQLMRGDEERAGVRSFEITGAGKLDAQVGISGVAIALKADLATNDPITFKADGLDLSPLSKILPKKSNVKGKLDLDLTLEVDADRPALVISGTAGIREGFFNSPAVAPSPVEGWSVSSKIKAAFDLADRGQFETRVDGDFSSIPGFLRLSVKPDAETHTIRLAVGISKPTECQKAYEAIPEAMLPHLGRDGAKFTGSMQPVLAYVLRLNDPWSFVFDIDGFPNTCNITAITKRDYDPIELTSNSYTFKVTSYVSKSDIVVGPGTPDFLSYESMPPYVGAAMYLSEEIGFRYLDAPANAMSIPLMNKGIRISLERGRYVYGGSTLSQQLVKNLYFSRDKTLSRKLEELVVTWRMSKVVPKKRILELYLNCIEFGPNLYGIKRAASHYFGKSASELTPLEAVYLAALKPSPYQGAHDMRVGNSPVGGMLPTRLKELLDRLNSYGYGVTPQEVLHYCPYVVAFPTSSSPSAYKPIPRPDWLFSGGEPPPLPAGYDPVRAWTDEAIRPAPGDPCSFGAPVAEGSGEAIDPNAPLVAPILAPLPTE